MKKHFFNVIATLALVCGVFAFSGCTDFEKDINDLNDRLDALETGKIADLESQVASLQDALSAAQSAIDALKALGIEDMKDQLDDLQATVDGIDLSKYATLDYVNGTFATKDYVEELNTKLGALEGRVESLEGLYDSDVKISEILDKIDDAQADASSALGQIKALQDALGIYAETGAIQDALDLKMDIADFNDAFNEALKAALEDNDGMITTAIADAINEAVAKLSALFAQRLTSISLIPSAYLDGVPAIKFNSYLYNIKTVNAENETVKVGDPFRIAAEAVDVDYHISPSLITKEDISTPSYLIQEAELITRAGVDDIDLNVIDYDIESDVLTVSVRRDAGISLNHDDADYIYTAALKVPIAEKNLVEGETEANVYSEYAALYEDEVTPYIAALIDESKNQKSYNCTVEPNHFYATYAEAAAEASDIARTSAYDEAIDLLAMVTGCEGNIEEPTAVHKEITKSTLNANGLAFRFAVPAKPFILGSNNTDQQKFAYVDGSTLKSTYVNAPEGAEPNQASIDKTPVVRVELVDTVNSQIVDVRYFKVKWTPVPFVPEDEDLGLVYTFTDTLGCVDFNADITWDIFVEKVLSKVNSGAGLSYNDFLKIYKSADAEVKVDYVIAQGHNNTMTVTWDDDTPTYDEHAAAFHWNILISEYGDLIDGKNADEIEEGELLKTFTATIILPSNDDYNGTITFKVAVDVVAPVLPSIHGFTEMNWDVFGELARIYPVQYKSTFQTEPTAVYAYNLNTLFNVNEDNLFVDNILTDDTKLTDEWACRRWDLQFSKNQTNGYLPAFGAKANYAPDNDVTGYSLLDALVEAAVINPNNDANPAVPYANWFNAPVEDIELSLNNNESGIDLLNKNRVKSQAEADAAAGNLTTVTLDVWGRVNAYNAVRVHSFDVWFVNPLTIEPELEDTFTDLVIGGDAIDATKAFEGNVVDYAGYEVAVYAGGTGLPEELRVYYGIAETPVWNVDEALISLVKDGDNLVINNTLDINSAADRAKMQVLNDMSVTKSLTVSDDQRELIFKNEFGWAVTGDVNIYVPVTITHKWGVETFWVKIVLQPAKVTGNAIL